MKKHIKKHFAKTRKNKIMDRVNETLHKISQDTLKTKKIGDGDEEVTLFMIPRFDLTASNVRNFMSS